MSIIQHTQAMLSEVVATVVVSTQIIVATVLLALSPETGTKVEQAEFLEWSLLTFAGSVLAAGGAFCFNTSHEVRKIVIGRCLFTIVAGVIGSRLMSIMHPWVTELLGDPFLKIGAGFLFGLAAYLLSWPFVARAYQRAPLVARKQVEAIEERFVAKVAASVKLDAAEVANELAKKTEQP